MGQRRSLVGAQSEVRPGLGRRWRPVRPGRPNRRVISFALLPHALHILAQGSFTYTVSPSLADGTPGTGVSFLLQPTSFYNLTLSVNGTVLSSVPDLSTSTSANLTSLPFGTHSVQAIFHSKDTTREPSQEGVARLTGIEVHWEGCGLSS